MLLSMKWLKDYIPLEVSPKEFADGMTMSGSKVEGYSYEGDGISRIVVGKVLEITNHPNADKLVICKVDVGENRPLQIVTGAKNVVEGALVPVCLDGATLPGGKVIHTGELRGVLSEGMLCSLGELGLTKYDFPYAIEDGIFLIQEDCKVGEGIREAIGLNDICIDFEITSNRPDCLSVIGLAREAAAWFGKPFNLKKPSVNGSGDDIHSYLKGARIEATELCSRYMAKVVKNVKIEPSPHWMRERLRASGVRPINNLVDITNYVMLSYGQPMHAFDLECLEGKEIKVRTTHGAESIITLGGEEKNLPDGTLVIADCKKPVGIAGVMGGKGSGITEKTQTVVLESACFDGTAVRLSSKAVGLRTESSSRFEKGLNPNICEDPLMYACELVEKLGAGEVVDGIIDVKPRDVEPVSVSFSPDWVRAFLGADISDKQMIESLQKLEFTIKGSEVIVPSFRIDIHHKADIAEEIARMIGYDKIPVSNLKGMASAKKTPIQIFQEESRDLLRGFGLSEIIPMSFLGSKAFDMLGFSNEDKRRNALHIKNPFGDDSSLMRTTPYFHMLQTLCRNYNNRNEKAWLYELGRVYSQLKDGSPLEEERLAFGLYGGECDFFTLKGILETYRKHMRIENWTVEAFEEMPFHPGRAAALKIDGEVVGVFGEVHPTVAEKFGASGIRLYMGDFSVETLMKHQNLDITYRQLPKYPASHRDLSLVCPQDLPAASLMDAIKKGVGALLEDLTLFDIYCGEQIASGQKSLSFAVRMRADDHTLTDAEADEAIKKALNSAKKLGAILRQ